MADDIVHDHGQRIAVLEEIARGTKAVLERIERRLDTIEATQRTDFRWLLGIMLGGFSLTIGGFGAVLGLIARSQHSICPQTARRPARPRAGISGLVRNRL